MTEDPTPRIKCHCGKDAGHIDRRPFSGNIHPSNKPPYCNVYLCPRGHKTWLAVRGSYQQL